MYLKINKKPNDVVLCPTETKQRRFGSGLQKIGTLVPAFPTPAKKKENDEEEGGEEEEEEKGEEGEGDRRHTCSNSKECLWILESIELEVRRELEVS